MKLIVEISDEKWQRVKDGTWCGSEEIAKGTPLEPCSDAISRQAAEECVKNYCSSPIKLLMEFPKLPSVHAEQRTKRCIWCDSPYRIEYYWIDREGNTASYEDEGRHIVATGIAKYCPNCGAKMEADHA